MSEAEIEYRGCDHRGSKKWLPVALPLGEVYMCECGCLIDVVSDKNYADFWCAMTDTELHAQIREIIKNERQRLVQIVTETLDVKLYPPRL